MIKGQEELCKKIDSISKNDFPRTIMLMGDYGSGRHQIVNLISEKFGFEIEDISNNLTFEKISEITEKPYPKIYLIDCAFLTLKNENTILKFLEEPLKNAFIVLLASSNINILGTVKNRCQLWNMAQYDTSVIYSMLPMELRESKYADVLNTPGKIEKYKDCKIAEMFNFADKIFKNIYRANVANTLTLSNHLAFKKELDKYDVDLFFSVLLEESFLLCKTNFKNCISIYMLTKELNNSKYIFNIDKKALFENYLIKLKCLDWSN